jgi:acyl-CoA thioesterase
MAETETKAALVEMLDGLDGERLRLAESWIRTLLRKSGASRPGASAGPLTDFLHIRRVSSEDGRAVFELDSAPEVLNPYGFLAGPAVYAMVDYSMGAATASTLAPNQTCATVEIKMSYLSSVRGGTVRAETEVVKRGRQIVFLESKVRDDAGRLIATATGSFIVIGAGA